MYSLDYYHSFIGNYMLQPYSVPSIKLGIGGTVINKRKKVFVRKLLMILLRRNINKNKFKIV